ncbi:MAG: hypothetical protein P0Y55_00885 [Candidatus Cohnella colombiensis]|uniref:Uncharacterized protein n=1 Tax=Candidatus Cohnella colombiensis TaxID=3121368 RepID=A0AA95F0K7_9BACL|nr:MAG: hypothetical protein P0Y55_00885 [Cohnella sp.]
MKRKLSFKAMMGAFMGLVMTGGWLLADLMLPEPWGDYLLYGAMAVVNVMAGWLIAKLSAHQDNTVDESPIINATGTRPYESEA